MTITVCAITGSRADYGLLKGLLRRIRESSRLTLQLLVTGSHFSSMHDETYREIESDGHIMDKKIDLDLSGDTSLDVTLATSECLRRVGVALEQLKPDVVLVLGDRYEVFASTVAAMLGGYPIAHLHGGESTEGAIDEAMRHSITKMAHLHFVAAKSYAERVIQLGENPARVFNVGSIGIDNIHETKWLSKDELENYLGFRFRQRNLLATFHPVTLEKNSGRAQVCELLKALEQFEDLSVVFTQPNADTENSGIKEEIIDYVASRENSTFFESLGNTHYLSCLRFVDGVIGNSSSGFTEVPTMKKGTINIGDRQKGRLAADSVINCLADKESICEAIEKMYSPQFQAQLACVENPYGGPGAANRIVKILEECSYDDLLKKQFFTSQP